MCSFCGYCISSNLNSIYLDETRTRSRVLVDITGDMHIAGLRNTENETLHCVICTQHNWLEIIFRIKIFLVNVNPEMPHVTIYNFRIRHLYLGI